MKNCIKILFAVAVNNMNNPCRDKTKVVLALNLLLEIGSLKFLSALNQLSELFTHFFSNGTSFGKLVKLI